jgi:hypothetical protein
MPVKHLKWHDITFKPGPGYPHKAGCETSSSETRNARPGTEYKKWSVHQKRYSTLSVAYLSCDRLRLPYLRGLLPAHRPGGCKYYNPRVHIMTMHPGMFVL